MPRFNRPLNIVDNSQPLLRRLPGAEPRRYFMQLTESAASRKRRAGFGKLCELQALCRFVSQRPKVIGLLPEEARSFELVLVGNHRHPVRRQVLA